MIVWPQKILKPQDISVDLAPRNLKTTPAQSGFTQVVSNSAGIWRAVFSNIPVYTREMILTWRAIANQAEGQMNTIVIPIYDTPRAPVPDGYSLSNCSPGQGIPHSDGTFHSDGTGYVGQIVNVEVAADVATGQVTIPLKKINVADLLPGQRFSINHRLYEIRSVTSQNATDATVIVRPPLREPVFEDDVAIFDYPTLRVKLASDNEMWLTLKINRYGTQTVNFIEDL